jgi:adenosine deaminase
VIFALAARNGVALPYASVEALPQCLRFTNCRAFWTSTTPEDGVLLTEQDFYDMARAYFVRSR